jgi:glycosyltransferase involved in cell wall biosynthesis
MRVAVLDPSLFTFPYDHALCEALARRGWEVVLVGSPRPTSSMIPGLASGYERWAHFYRRAHGPWARRIEPLRLALKGLEHVGDMVRLVRRLEAWRPDVIHFQWLPLPVVDRWFLRRLRRLASLVLTVHDTEPFQGSPSSPLQLWGLRDALRRFDGWVVHTEFSRRELVRRTGLPEDRVFVVPHGVLDYYRRLRGTARRETGPPDVPRILFFGLIKPYKGLDLLVEALARLPDELRRTVRLDVVGLPRMDVRPLQARARDLGVGENVRWDLRFVPETEVPEIFESATVVVLPYRRADQSSVLMTALAFDKPVVATRVGGLAEVLRDGVHGLLVEPGDVEGLARALATLLTDAGLRRRMAEAIRTLAAGDLSWDAVAARTLEVYGEIRRRGPGRDTGREPGVGRETPD